MIRRHAMAILPTVAFALVFVFTGQSAQADWGISVQGEFRTPGYAYYGDRITSEYRRGYQVDDWVERGESSVTESPLFADGVRLAAWATRYDDDFDFALASGIYFFEIPSRARSIRIKIYYDGEADRGDFNGGLAGRVWVRRSRIGDDYEEYYPREGRYEDADEPLYGDTFILRARKHLEILRVSADDHIIDGMMELHVVAEGRQRIDVKYIEVETYSYLPSIRVVTRYYRDYAWRPWYDYSYWYFYTGPVYHFADHYYVRYTYPRYRYHYVTIRKRYNDYLRVYYINRPHRHVRWANVVHVRRGTRRTWDRDRLNRWTRDHEEARKSYSIVSTKTRRSDDVRKTRTRIRSVLSTHSRVSPAEVRARSSDTTDTNAALRGTTSIRTRGSSIPDVKRRSESSDTQRERQYRTSPNLRRDIDTSRSSRRDPVQVKTRDSSRTQDERRSSIRTRSSSSSQREPQRNVRSAPSRSAREEQQETKKRRESVRSRTPERKVESPQRKAPPRQTETKKDDDDDDDKKKSNNSNTKRRSTDRRNVRKK